MTPSELLALAEHSLTTDIVTAGRAFGMGRALSYELAGRDAFPVHVLRLGHRLRVRTADLLAALGVTPETTEAPRSSEPERFTLIKSDATSDLDQPGDHHTRPPAA